MRFVYLMDPVERVSPEKDTTFALIRASQKRGHESFFAAPADLTVTQDDVSVKAARMEIHAAAPFVTRASDTELRIGEVDAVFIRKDPPFDQPYLYMTQLLEKARGRTLLINDPRGLREANEKLYTLHFSRYMPKTCVSSDRDKLLNFVDTIGGTGVIKPLDGAGGAGVLMLARSDRNARSILDVLTREGTSLAMVQEYLPAVREGDKRVLLIDGEILGAINRIPRVDDVRSNIHAGGSVEPCDVTDDERAIVAAMAPRLREDGLYFVGLDFIGGKLTEVNVTSPTGVQELSRHRGRDVAEDVIAWVERRAQDLLPDLRSIPLR